VEVTVVNDRGSAYSGNLRLGFAYVARDPGLFPVPPAAGENPDHLADRAQAVTVPAGDNATYSFTFGDTGLTDVDGPKWCPKGRRAFALFDADTGALLADATAVYSDNTLTVLASPSGPVTGVQLRLVD